VTGPPPAGFLCRLLASLVDRALLLALWAVLAGWALIAYLEWAWMPADLLDLGALLALLLLWGGLCDALYAVLFVGGCGQTPGKMLCGIAVVRRDGAPAGHGRALLRWLGGWIAAAPLGLGFAPALFGAERRGLHDWIAGTRVVRAAGR
jgi:uncharacterized RDD family membrane protein YckC